MMEVISLLYFWTGIIAAFIFAAWIGR